MALERGSVLNNRYRIDALLGQGGRGAVYLGWDSNLRIPVAIKENLDATPEAQEQFFYEANILARLSHPNLTRVTDYFIIPGQGQYLVMDYVQGDDLEKIVEQNGPVPEDEALTWTAQICNALNYLHSQKPPIIHRDIKPANIKIRPDGQAILVDFGIAKSYDPRSGTLIGAKAITPGYSPPEQYGFGTTDPRSDVYALGATLYHLLTGSPLPESVQRAAGATTITPPRQINAQISASTEIAVVRAVEVLADRRYQTVKEFQSALNPKTVMLQPEIPPSAPSVKVKRDRRWWIFGTILGIFVVAVIFSLIFVINNISKKTGEGKKPLFSEGCDPPCYTFTNHLATRVKVWIEGVEKGTLEPGATKTFWGSSSPVKVRWESIPQTNLSGKSIGIPMSAEAPNISNGSKYEIINKIGNELFFAPVLTNNTDAPCEVSIDDGYAGEERPGILNPGAQNVFVGYHQLYQNSNVKLYCKDKVYFWGLPVGAAPGEHNPLLEYIQPQSGLVLLSVP